MTSYSDTRLALTYSDVVARLVDRIGCASDDTVQERKIKRAVRDALRDLPAKHDWRYYNREWQFVTSASSALNITYTHSTRTAVVNSGTIPSDAIYGQFFYKRSRCVIESVSGSNLTLDATLNPGENVTGASVVWTRAAYPMPSITKVHGLWRVGDTLALQYMMPADITLRDILVESAGSVVAYTIANSSALGANDVILSPAPTVAEPYKMSATVQPSMPTLFRVDAAASGTNGASTFTAANASADWIGAVVRAAPASSTKRDSIINEEWTWQAVITNVSGTTVTVNTPLPTTFVSETVLISSLIDIDIESMQTYFEALAYLYYTRNMSNEDANRARDHAEAAVSRAYMSARAADNRAKQSTPHDSFMYARYGGIFPDLRFARGVN